MNWIVIMAGGGGTRLWPLSRRKRPKQFLPLLPGGETLIGATVRRVTANGVAPIERTVVVTAASQVEEVRRCVPALPVENIVVEPEGRNTAPCIGLATVELMRRDREARVGVLPSDQFVADEPRFAAALARAFAVAGRGHVAIVGIRPAAPETGFGYVEMGGEWRDGVGDGPRVREVLRFVEKPDRATAERYVAAGNHVWNAGMFFFRAQDMHALIGRHLPDLGAILDEIQRHPARTAELYPRAPKISIDYGVMEKMPAGGGLFVVEGDFAWDDVGSFAALAKLHPHDGAGNTVLGDALAIEARDNIVIADGKLVAAVGVEGLVIVATGDAVLVVPRERAQDVRKIVAALEAAKRDPYL